MNEENKTLNYAEAKKENRDITAASEANVNHLAEVLDTNDFKALVVLKDELRDTWHKKQVFRTETEMRMSVLQDAKYPTKAAKYWQCVREQNVFFENLMSLSFDYRKNEVEIKKLKKKINEEEDELDYKQKVKRENMRTFFKLDEKGPDNDSSEDSMAANLPEHAYKNQSDIVRALVEREKKEEKK